LRVFFYNDYLILNKPWLSSTHLIVLLTIMQGRIIQLFQPGTGFWCWQ